MEFAVGQSKQPGVRVPGAVFHAAIRQCLENDGKPPAKANRRPAGPKPVALPPTHERDPLRDRSGVIATAVEAIGRRRAEGMSVEANRAVTMAKASALADGRNLKDAERADLLGWFAEALNHVLEGVELADPAADLRAATGRQRRRAAA